MIACHLYSTSVYTRNYYRNRRAFHTIPPDRKNPRGRNIIPQALKPPFLSSLVTPTRGHHREQQPRSLHSYRKFLYTIRESIKNQTFLVGLQSREDYIREGILFSSLVSVYQNFLYFLFKFWLIFLGFFRIHQKLISI